MDKLKIDAVITDLELQLETNNNPYGSYVNFKFIDTYPNFPKVNNMIEEIKKRTDVDLINFEYSYTGIHEDTDLKYFDIIRH
jgi:3'-phosphoadenosine 5'-phosphosulfate sulfotransferase (PAPS reductase)/FAD synthetase